MLRYCTSKALSAYLLAVAANSIFEVQCRDENAFYCYGSQGYLYKTLVCFMYHYNIKANLFVDIAAADFPSNNSRFFFSYHVYSVAYNMRLLFSFTVFHKLFIYSITTIFPAANWFEREIWDMFGILFLEHPDMRRILTDYGFFGHPLKKDYPLSGFIEVQYDDQYRCILYNDLSLVQDYRV